MDLCKNPRKMDCERFHTGEMDPSAHSEFASHLSTCALCSTYIKELEEGQAVFLFKHPFATLAPEKRETPAWRQFIYWKPFLVPVGMLALCVLVFLPGFFSSEQGAQTPSEKIIYKGGTQIGMVYNRQGEIGEWKTGEPYHAGDELQLYYIQAGSDFKFVQQLSIDAKGVVSFYRPHSGDEAHAFEVMAGGRQPVPVSFVLDDTPGFELAVLVFSHKPLEKARLQAWGQKAFKESRGRGESLARILETSLDPVTTQVKTLLIPK